MGVAANSLFNETDYNRQVAKFLFSSVQGGVCKLIANVNGLRLFELSGSEITASPSCIPAAHPKCRARSAVVPGLSSGTCALGPVMTNHGSLFSVHRFLS